MEVNNNNSSLVCEQEPCFLSKNETYFTVIPKKHLNNYQNSLLNILWSDNYTNEPVILQF